MISDFSLYRAAMRAPFAGQDRLVEYLGLAPKVLGDLPLFDKAQGLGRVYAAGAEPDVTCRRTARDSRPPKTIVTARLMGDPDPNRRGRVQA